MTAVCDCMHPSRSRSLEKRILRFLIKQINPTSLRIIVHQMSLGTHSGQEFIGSFDAAWSKLAWINLFIFWNFESYLGFSWRNAPLLIAHNYMKSRSREGLAAVAPLFAMMTRSQMIPRPSGILTIFFILPLYSIYTNWHNSAQKITIFIM